jgi:hypothetical protein
MKSRKKGRTSIESFVFSQGYKLASQSECPNEKCKDCSALFTFKDKTRCYVYEQQIWKDKLEFHPRRNFNCSLFDSTDAYCSNIEFYRKALAKGADPDTDPEYQEVLKKESDFYYKGLNIMHNEHRGKNKNTEIKTAIDYVMAFQEEPECRDCRYCRPNYAPMAPTSHICENDEVEEDFIFGEDKPCDKWEYRKGKPSPSSSEVFYSAHPEYHNLDIDNEWDDDEDD